MSYNTHFALTIQDGGPEIEYVAREVTMLVDKTEPGSRRYEEGVAFWTGALAGDPETKWYERTETMTQISQMWPDTLFTLEGEGDEQGDVWIEYHFNGKVQKERQPEWVRPRFDPGALQ